MHKFAPFVMKKNKKTKNINEHFSLLKIRELLSLCTGGRASDILVKTPGVRSSIHYLGTLSGFSLHSNFGALPCHDAINEKLKRSGPRRYLRLPS